MHLGLVIYSNIPEVVWNAFRLAIHSLDKGDRVSVFLIAGGVELESMKTPDFNVEEKAMIFLEKKGKMMACTGCLNLRGLDENILHPKSTLNDLYELVRDCDRVVSF